MKMKRFFNNKQRKKKINESNDGIIDTKPVDLSDDVLSSSVLCESPNNMPKTTGKKKRTRRKKAKNQKRNDVIVPETDDTGIDGTYRAPDGTKVVLRRGPAALEKSSSVLSSRKFLDRSKDDKRIPGSESSSRTASSASASSSSSHRWSVRRPWSLVDTFRSQSGDEVAHSRSSDVPRQFDGINESHRPVSSICTLPRGAYLDESSMENNRSSGRTLMLDFGFFRRFKRSTSQMNTPADPNNTSGSGDLSQTRGSFRLKDLTKSRKKKKKRQSWNESSFPAASYRSPSNSVASPLCDDFPNSRMMSPTDSLAFDPVEASIPEEQGLYNDARVPAQPQSNASSASVDTITCASDFFSRPSSQCTSNRSSACPDVSYQFSSMENMVHCDKCQKLRRGTRRSHCTCSRTSCGSRLSVMDTDRELSHHVAAMSQMPKGKLSNVSSANVTPCSTVASFDYRASASLDDLCDGGSMTNSSLTTVQASYGGSLSTLPYSPSQSQEDILSTSLPRRRCIANDAKFKLQSPKSSLTYTSSPQLSVSNRRSAIDHSTQVKERRKSTTVRFSEEGRNGNVRLRAATDSVIQSSNAAVDSPIKRAIGYPGVVLRRHQDRGIKNNGGPRLNKAASSDLLTGESRSKQVMSLNMEDLPTYEKMRNLSRWRSSTVSNGRELSNLPNRLSGDAGRARLRAAVLYQRYVSHCTSCDDVRSVEFLLGGDRSMDHLNNLDDDEFLDLYLAAPVNASPRDSYRSNHSQEPSSKRVKTLRKSVASFANLISPGKPNRNKLQRSSSFKESSAPTFKPYRPPGSNNGSSNGVSGSSGSVYTPGRRNNVSASKNRSSKLWCETFDYSGLDEAELKRQEAIFELYQGEKVMVQDLKMAKQTYRDSMMTLKMLTGEEVTRIFGKLDCLLPLHEDLLARLEKGRTKDGRIDGVGHVFIDWFPTLSPYNEYCANQADAKETLDAVVNREARVRDFLQRCLESPFSRKLDLWSYLDLPRSRLVKYPLLLKAILKVTPREHADASLLEKAMAIINGIISRVDYLTGERQSKFVQSKLEYLDDKHRCKEVEQSRKIICSGQLKGSRGTKLQVFLFDLALVLTRNATRGDKMTYQVYRQPLPLKSLIVETEEGGKLSGSFKSGLLSSDKAKHSFRVRSEELHVAYTLVASDEHDKKQWINSLLEATSAIQPPAELPGSRSPITRRTGSEKSALEKPVDVRMITVKRSSSAKSDSGSNSPWRRNRSMTSNGVLDRRNSKEKKDLVDNKKQKSSPLHVRRNGKPESLTVSETSDANPQSSADLLSADENSAYRRSKSLTSSPITYLANLPHRSPRRSARLGRSESCSTKPPTGRNYLMTSQTRIRSSSQTPPVSPRIAVARSIPDLYTFDHQETQKVDQLSLEDAKKRLAPVKDEEASDGESTRNDNSASEIESTRKLTPPTAHKNPQLSSICHLLIDSPHPAASNTSEDFPIVEEDLISPFYKSSASNQLLSQFSTPTGIIALPLSPPSSNLLHLADKPIKCTDSGSTSSESLDDVSPLMDDVGLILDKAAESSSDESPFCDDEAKPTNEVVTPPNICSDVTDTLNDVVDRVCELHKVIVNAEELTTCCRDDYVIIKNEDGMAWSGNNVEMTV